MVSSAQPFSAVNRAAAVTNRSRWLTWAAAIELMGATLDG